MYCLPVIVLAYAVSAMSLKEMILYSIVHVYHMVLLNCLSPPTVNSLLFCHLKSFCRPPSPSLLLCIHNEYIIFINIHACNRKMAAMRQLLCVKFLLSFYIPVNKYGYTTWLQIKNNNRCVIWGGQLLGIG